MPAVERIISADGRAAMPPGLPGIDSIRQQRAHENFPVALRALPPGVRDDLVAIYGFARLVDDVGDRYDGDRLAALDWLEADLDHAVRGTAVHPLVGALTPVIRAHQVDVGLCRDLIEANRRDQHQNRYGSFDDLLGYCRLSANPVGRLVLAVFDSTTPSNEALSDDVCTALQIVEHLQDVGEDARDGRIYLPLDDLATSGCDPDDVLAATASPPLRHVVSVEATRAASLLSSGPTLVRQLHGWARLAVAGFVAGGLATVDAIRDADHDVLGHGCRPSKRRVAMHAARLLTNSVRAPRHGSRSRTAA
ncbi:MAG: squalene synthase HpnC [Ilumatobacteraceae bacterium]